MAKAPLGHWDVLKDGTWGISFPSTHDSQAVVLVPSESCNHRPSYTYETQDKKGNPLIGILATQGSFIPVKLSPYNRQWLQSLVELIEELEKLQDLEATTEDDIELDRAALAEKVIAYESRYGQLAESAMLALVGDWKDWRLIAGIKVLTKSSILTERQRYPVQRHIPTFTEGETNDRLEKAFRAVIARLGVVDVEAIAKSAGVDMELDRVQQILEDLHLAIQLPEEDDKDKDTAC